MEIVPPESKTEIRCISRWSNEIKDFKWSVGLIIHQIQNEGMTEEEEETMSETTELSTKPYMITQHEIKKAFYFVKADSEEEAYQKHSDRESKCVGEEYVSVYDTPLSIEHMGKPSQEEVESQQPTMKEG